MPHSLIEWQIGIAFGLIAMAAGLRRFRGRLITAITIAMIAVGFAILIWAMFSS